MKVTNLKKKRRIKIWWLSTSAK